MSGFKNKYSIIQSDKVGHSVINKETAECMSFCLKIKRDLPRENYFSGLRERERKKKSFKLFFVCVCMCYLCSTLLHRYWVSSVFDSSISTTLSTDSSNEGVNRLWKPRLSRLSSGGITLSAALLQITKVRCLKMSKNSLRVPYYKILVIETSKYDF